MTVPKVYLDTNVLKFSATELPRMAPRQETINWGGIEHEITVHDFVEVNPNEKIGNPDLKVEADSLSELAGLGKLGAVEYLIQMETMFESWGLPNMDSSTGKFYGAPVKTVDAPIQYGRTMIGGGQDAKEMQYDFLSRIDNGRFKELQKITGAYQGKNPPNRNQLLDAFHVWCAEHNDSDYFLTLDFKLIRVVNNGGAEKVKTKLVRPSELLAILKNGT